MSDDSRLLELFSVWHDGFVRRQEVAPAEVCRECPELLGELKRYIEAFHLLDSLSCRGTNGQGSIASISAHSPSAGKNGLEVTLALGTKREGPWPEIPGYEILEEIGRGGMGVVYKARHLHLDLVVALKLILSGAHAGPDERERFLRDAKTLASLKGKGVVEVFDCKEHDGHLYFSMEYHSRGSLADHCKETLLPPRKAAEYLEQIARTIHAAHEVGFIHRDLKPGNVLLGDDGRPRVTDFGLARRINPQDGITPAGAVLGTPGYMAPELASGRVLPGPGCDVYGLGATLYDLLTGRPPFLASSMLEILKQTLEDEPVPPHLLNPRVDRDLETICLKCLEKDSARRYATAQELAEDLARYRAHKPIRARSYNFLAWAARVVNQPRYDASELRLWASLLWLLGGLIFAGHLLTFALLQAGGQAGYVWLSRAGMFLLGAGLLWLWRRKEHPSTNAAERQAWSIWIGYFAAYGTAAAASRLLIRGGLLSAGPDAPAGWEEVITYPFAAILSGLAFFIMGGSYWGRYYALGTAFFGLALLLPLRLEWAPVAFGLLWMGSLAVAGQHIRWLNGQRGELNEGKSW